MYVEDVLVVLYPNKKDVKSVLILNPFDSDVKIFNVDSIEEVKKVLRENLPFCDQGHEPLIHLGFAVIMEWENLSSSQISVVLYPNKKDVKSVLILNPFDSDVKIFNVDSIEEVKKVLRENLPLYDQGHEPLIDLGFTAIMEWENLPSSQILIGKPEDIDKALG